MPDLDEPISIIMTAEVTSVKATAPLGEAVGVLLQRHISGVPVTGPAGQVVGVHSLTDVARKLRAQTADPSEVETVFYDSIRVEELLRSLIATAGTPDGSVADVMCRQVISVTPETSIRDACKLMAARHIHRLLVIEASGKLRGIVSTLDVVGYVSRS